MNVHDANGDERGATHGTWAAVHGWGREESYVRVWEEKWRSTLVLKWKVKLPKNLFKSVKFEFGFQMLIDVNRAPWAGSLADVSKLICVGMLLLAGCWSKHNDNVDNTKRNWIVLLNIINSMRKIIQHYLDWGATLALFKGIQALGWINFVTGAGLLWLVSPKIQQPNKCRMARTTSAQSIQAQSSTRKNTLLCQELLYFFVCILYIAVTWIGSEWVYL